MDRELSGTSVLLLRRPRPGWRPLSHTEASALDGEALSVSPKAMADGLNPHGPQGTRAFLSHHPQPQRCSWQPLLLGKVRRC